MIVHHSKNVVLGLAYMAAALLLLQACRKKEITIIEQYNPPDLQIYGTWLLQNKDANDTSKTYMVLTDKQTNYYYMLYQSKYGIKTKASGIFFATENTLDLNDDYHRRNYKKVNDTLWLTEAVGATEKYVKQNNTSIAYDNWLKELKTVKTVKLPEHFNVHAGHTIGVDGDYLYFNPCNPDYNNLYKYNTLTKKYTDSISSYFSGCLFHENYVYRCDEGTAKIKKLTADLSPLSGIPGTTSANALKDATSLSVRTSDNTFFAYSYSDYKLYSGIQGATFAEYFDFNFVKASGVVYLKNDQFLMARSGNLYKVTLNPFVVVESYALPGHYIFSVSSSLSGKEIWVTTAEALCIKISL